MQYLLDTDICIYWLKGRKSVQRKINIVGQNAISICVITASELYFGAYNSNKVQQNLSVAENFIKSMSVIALSDNSQKEFGRLKAQLRQAGRPVADFDLLIASVAMTEDLILVTNNTLHYQRICGLKLDNWAIETKSN